MTEGLVIRLGLGHSVCVGDCMLGSLVRGFVFFWGVITVVVMNILETPCCKGLNLYTFYSCDFDNPVIY